MLPRRRFVLALGALLPLPFVARRLHRLAVAELDPRLLRALGAAVLPTELGERGLERAVAGFERWLAGYREGVELVHGYGTAEIRYSGPSPALRWSTQLRELDAAAVRQRGRSFAKLELAERQALVRGTLEGQRLGAMPAIDRAAHVSLGLLAFFYESPEATDLCYQARIGSNGCRPLADSERRPLPLADRG
ncbi:MAG TPA: hypothetical protein VGQ69_07415 [Gemmatimonadales bacterium]|jgi:hypothetical protein|nr:hypothetical protein [Gemmatimonadales bacterium]